MSEEQGVDTITVTLGADSYDELEMKLPPEARFSDGSGDRLIFFVPGIRIYVERD